MKIVLATPIYPPEIGGPATYIKEIAERLCGTHSITIVAYASTSEYIPGTKLITVSKQRALPLRLIKYTWVLFRESKNADIIYVQNAMASGLPAVIVSALRRVPVILKFVSDEAWERATQQKYTKKKLGDFLIKPEGPLKIKLMMMLQGFVLRRATLVTTPSRYLSEEIVKAYGVQKARAVVNYNAADKTETLPFETKRVAHQIATTARLVEWKGIDGLIRAMAIVTKSIPDAQLVIAGDGPLETSLKKLSEDIGVSKNVTFLGRVSRAETWQLRKNSEIYVLNSSYEGLPHTVLTSFAAEIPTIATDTAGTNEAVYHEETGLLVPVGDDEALARAIIRLLHDQALQEKIVGGGSRILREKFSWEAHLQGLSSLFETVLAKPNN